MLIGINNNYKIKQINKITDLELTQVEVDKQEVFGTQTDDMILCYCYKSSKAKYSIYFDTKEKFAEWEKLKLQQENESLKSQLSATQEAINYLLMGGAK